MLRGGRRAAAHILRSFHDAVYLGIFQEGVHLPPQPVRIVHPKLVRFSVAARCPWLFTDSEALRFGPHQLSDNPFGLRIPDAKMTDSARLTAQVERENDRGISDLKLGVIRFDLCRFYPQDLAVLLNRGRKVFYTERNMKRIVRHNSSPFLIV